jgi:alpha-beta hydrolase superfamily lysophospholipase
MRFLFCLALFFTLLGLGFVGICEERTPSVEFLNIESFDGVKLAGTLTVPNEMRAIVIPLHGSFVQTRDGDLDGAQKWMFPEGVPKRGIFRDLTNLLLEQGVGSFRFDKRASGESGGVYEDTDLLTLAKDADVILKTIRKRFPGVPVGLVGQSEGSLVALKSYEIGTRPDWMILQGPLLDPMDKFLEFQKTHAAAPFLNDTSGDLRRRMPYLSAFYEAAYNGDLLDQIYNSDADHYELRIPGWSHITSLRKYRQYAWSGYDLLKNVSIPTLLVVGSLDGNVSPFTVEKVKTEQNKGKEFRGVDVKILPGLEHSFREVRPGESFVDAMKKPLHTAYKTTVVEYVSTMLGNCPLVFAD